MWNSAGCPAIGSMSARNNHRHRCEGSAAPAGDFGQEEPVGALIIVWYDTPFSPFRARRQDGREKLLARLTQWFSQHAVDVEPTAYDYRGQNDNDDCTENALSALVTLPCFNWRPPTLRV